jgi:hypothetical protein
MRRRLGEVDVVSETLLSRTFQQPKQRCAFFCSGSPPDHYDDAMIRPCRCQVEKVIPVASQQKAITLVGELKDSLVGGIAGKGVTQKRDIVTELLEQVA